MKKKKMSSNTKSVASIVVSCAVCAYCVLSGIYSAIEESGFSIPYIDTISGQINGMFGIAEDVGKEIGEKVNAEDLDPSKIESWQDLESALDLEGVLDSEKPTEQEETTEPSAEVCQTITGTLVRVKDGDTYVLSIGGKDTTVRLIGVDTPESVAPASYSKENTEEGKKVSELVKARLSEGEVFTVEYDAQTEDKYGRTLAYLYFEDGTMVQEWLLTNGYAQVMTIQPNCKYASRFVEIEREAAENGIGIWAS